MNRAGTCISIFRGEFNNLPAGIGGGDDRHRPDWAEEEPARSRRAGRRPNRTHACQDPERAAAGVRNSILDVLLRDAASELPDFAGGGTI